MAFMSSAPTRFDGVRQLRDARAPRGRRPARARPRRRGSPRSARARATSAKDSAGQRRRGSEAPGCRTTSGWAVIGRAASACRTSAAVSASRGSTVTGGAPDERDDLEEAQHLVLVVGVPDPAVERRRAVVAGARGDAGAEPLHEGVGVAAAPVELDGEVVLRGAVPLEEGLDAALVDGAAGDHVRVRRDDVHVVPGPRPALEEFGVPGQAEIGDAGVGVGRAQGLQRRDGDHEVADAVRAEHDDAPDLVDLLADRPERADVQRRRVGDDLGRQRLLAGRLGRGRAHESSPPMVADVVVTLPVREDLRSLWTRAWRVYLMTRSMLVALWSDRGRSGARGARAPTRRVRRSSRRRRSRSRRAAVGARRQAPHDVVVEHDGNRPRPEHQPDARTTGS